MKGDSQLIIKQVRGDCNCNNPQLAAYLIHVRKLEKDFDALELQHVPREHNSAADDLSARASTWASVPEGVFERRLLKPTAQPAELGEGDQAGATKPAVRQHSTYGARPGLGALLRNLATSQSYPHLLWELPMHGSPRSGTT